MDLIFNYSERKQTPQSDIPIVLPARSESCSMLGPVGLAKSGYASRRPVGYDDVGPTAGRLLMQILTQRHNRTNLQPWVFQSSTLAQQSKPCARGDGDSAASLAFTSPYLFSRYSGVCSHVDADHLNEVANSKHRSLLL